MYFLAITNCCFSQVKFQLIKTDAQPSVNDGVLVFVLGDLSIDNGPPMKFTHVFHLQKAPEASYFSKCH